MMRSRELYGLGVIYPKRVSRSRFDVCAQMRDFRSKWEVSENGSS